MVKIGYSVRHFTQNCEPFFCCLYKTHEEAVRLAAVSEGERIEVVEVYAADWVVKYIGKSVTKITAVKVD